MQYFSDEFAFSILEVILAITVFVIFSTSAIGILVQGYRSNRQAAELTIANQYATEGLEAARSIRNRSYSGLSNTVGTGIAQVGGVWLFSGANNTFDKYTRTLVVDDVFRDGSGNVVASGGTLDSQTKKVTANISWNAGYPQPQTLSQTTYLTSWRVSNSLGGMLVYGDGGTTTDAVKYRLLDGGSNSWGVVGSVADIDTGSSNRALRAVRLYSSSTRTEKVMVGRFYNGTTQYIYAEVYNGSSWGNVQLMSSWNAGSILNVRNFDGTYLANGDFMLIYSDDSNIPKSRIWNGISWSSQSNTSDVGGGPVYIVAASRPATNEVMMGVFDRSGDTNTAYFNGTTWSAAVEHATQAPSTSRQFIDFVWNQNTTTKGGLIYVDGNNDRSINIKIWTANGLGGGTWSAVAETANQPANLNNIVIANRKGVDEFTACARDTNQNLYCYNSNFTPVFSNPTNQIISTVGQTGNQRDFDMAYEGNTGTNGISVFSDGTNNPKLKKYTSATSTWDVTATGLTSISNNLRTVRIISTPKSDDLMMLFGDSATDLYSSVWNGSGNATFGALWGNQAIESFTDSNVVGQAESFQVTAVSSGSFNSINIYLNSNNASTNLIVGLYTNSGNNPGTLLTQGSSTALTGNAWNSITVPAVSVTAGTPYWVSVLSTAGVPRFRDRSSGPCTSQTSSQTNLTSLPTTWSTGQSYNTCPLSAYAGTFDGRAMTPQGTNGSANTEYWADFVWD